MPLILVFFIALVLALIVYHRFFYNRVPHLPRTGQDWGAAGDKDPRVALAAMMYAVATEDGPLTPVQEQRILSQLTSRVGLGPDLAQTCLAGGKRLARGVHGDLNSRLHQLVAPIEAQCSPEEKARRHRHAAPDRRAECGAPGVVARGPWPPLFIAVARLAR